MVAPEHGIVRQYLFGSRPADPASASTTRSSTSLEERRMRSLPPRHGPAGEMFLAMNADNLYPAGALARSGPLSEPGLPAFDCDDLVRSGNIPPDCVKSFALIEVDQAGYLTEHRREAGDGSSGVKAQSRESLGNFPASRRRASRTQQCLLPVASAFRTEESPAH